MQAPGSVGGSGLPCAARGPPPCGRSLRATHSLSVMGAGAVTGGSPGLAGRCGGAGVLVKHGGPIGCCADDATAAVAAGGAAGRAGWPGVAAAEMCGCSNTPAAAGLCVVAWPTGLRSAAAAAPLFTGRGVPLPFAGIGALRPPAAGRGLAMPGRMCCGRSGRGVCPGWRGDWGAGGLKPGSCPMLGCHMPWGRWLSG